MAEEANSNLLLVETEEQTTVPVRDEKSNNAQAGTSSGSYGLKQIQRMSNTDKQKENKKSKSAVSTIHKSKLSRSHSMTLRSLPTKGRSSLSSSHCSNKPKTLPVFAKSLKSRSSVSSTATGSSYMSNSQILSLQRSRDVNRDKKAEMDKKHVQHRFQQENDAFEDQIRSEEEQIFQELRLQEEEEKRRQEEEEKRRQEEEKRRQEEEEKRRQEEERRRQEEEMRRQEEEKRRQEEEEKRRQEEEKSRQLELRRREEEDQKRQMGLRRKLEMHRLKALEGRRSLNQRLKNNLQEIDDRTEREKLQSEVQFEEIMIERGLYNGSKSIQNVHQPTSSSNSVTVSENANVPLAPVVKPEPQQLRESPATPNLSETGKGANFQVNATPAPRLPVSRRK